MLAKLFSHAGGCRMYSYSDLTHRYYAGSIYVHIAVLIYLTRPDDDFLSLFYLTASHLECVLVSELKITN